MDFELDKRRIVSKMTAMQIRKWTEKRIIYTEMFEGAKLMCDIIALKFRAMSAFLSPFWDLGGE